MAQRSPTRRKTVSQSATATRASAAWRCGQPSVPSASQAIVSAAKSQAANTRTEAVHDTVARTWRRVASDPAAGQSRRRSLIHACHRSARVHRARRRDWRSGSAGRCRPSRRFRSSGSRVRTRIPRERASPRRQRLPRRASNLECPIRSPSGADRALRRCR